LTGGALARAWSWSGPAAAALIALGACGGDQGPPPPAPPAVTISLVAPPAGPDDVVVARVAGRPVWGSCVAAQAAGRHVDVRTALADCVDLELAAQEAARRGLDRDPEVLERAQQALVARLIDRDYRARYQQPTDLPAAFSQPILERNKWRQHHDEYRSSYYARIEAPDKTVPRGSPADVAAEQAARAAYATLAGRKDLFPPDVLGALRAAAGPTMKVIGDPFKGTTGDNVQPYYRDALFGLTSVGEVSAPVRGPYGWDLVLWTDVLPAMTTTPEAVAAEMFKPMRQRYFLDWAAEAGRGHRVELVADRATTERLLGGPATPASGGPRPPPGPGPGGPPPPRTP